MKAKVNKIDDFLSNIPQNKVDPILNPALRVGDESKADNKQADKTNEPVIDKTTPAATQRKTKLKESKAEADKPVKAFYNYKKGFSFDENEIIEYAAKQMSIEKGARVSQTQAINYMLAEQLAKYEKLMNRKGG